MSDVTPDTIELMRLVLDEAGLPATQAEIVAYARERVTVRHTMRRMYEAPFDDRYVGPIQKPVLTAGVVR